MRAIRFGQGVRTRNLTRNDDYRTAGRETLPKRADLWFGNWFNLPRDGAQAV